MSSDTSSSVIAAKYAELAELRAREASWKRIAVQSVALLRAQDDDERPEGMWLREQDHALLDAIEDHEVLLTAQGSWKWAQIKDDVSAPTPVSKFLTAPDKDEPRPVITPFRSAFPLEILEHIVSLCGPKAVAAFSQANFACLQMLSPRLLQNVVISSRKSGLTSIFADRSDLISHRLSEPLSIHLIQVLDVAATAIDWNSLWNHEFSRDRFSSGATTLDLVELIIRMDFNAISYDGLPNYGNWEPFFSDDEVAPEIRSFYPMYEVLELLNPAKVVFHRNEGLKDDDCQYHIARSGATEIAAWTRLREIHLVGVDLYVFGNDGPTENPTVPILETEQARKHFFLGPSIVNELAAGGWGSNEWEIRWDVSDNKSFRGYGGRLSELPCELAGEDGTFLMPKVQKATVVVQKGKDAKRAKELINEIEPTKRGRLAIQVVDGETLDDIDRGDESEEDSD